MCEGVCIPGINWVAGWPRLSLTVPICCSDSSSPNHQADPGSLSASEVRPRRRATDPQIEARRLLTPVSLCRVPQQLSPTASIQDTQKWLLKNRFNSYARLFSNFSGTHTLMMRSGVDGMLGNNTDFLTCFRF